MRRKIRISVQVACCCLPAWFALGAHAMEAPQVGTSGESVASASDTDRANAAELLNSAQRALGQLVATAEQEGTFKGGDGKAKPFWDGLKTANDELDSARTSLTLKSDAFFNQIGMVLAAVEQADVARIMNGGGSSKLAEETERLQKIVLRLNENYGPYAHRTKKGGPLTKEEQAALDKLIAQQDELEQKLKIVETKLGRNNRDIQKGIDRIRERSKQVRRSRGTGGFVGGFFAAHMISSWLWAWHWYWGPWGIWCPGWIDISIDIWVDGWDYLDYDWALMEDYYDVADLELDAIDISDAELMESDMYLDDGDFGLAEGDMAALTEDLPMGWDDVDTDAGYEAMDQMESNFDQTPYDSGWEVNTMDSYEPADFGGGFDDYGGGWDW